MPIDGYRRRDGSTIPRNIPQPRVAGPAPLQEQAFNLGANFVPSPYAQAGATALTAGVPAFNPDPEVRERYFRESIEPQAYRTFNENVIPGLAEFFAARGLNRSGLFADAATRAGSELTTNLAGINAELLYNDERLRAQSYENAAQRVPQGISQLLGMQVLPINLAASLGGQQRLIDQQQQGGRAVGGAYQGFAGATQGVTDALNRLGSINPFEFGESLADAHTGSGSFSQGYADAGQLSGSIIGGVAGGIYGGPGGAVAGASVGGSIGRTAGSYF